MTLSPMEPNVSNNSCLGRKSIQVYRLHDKRPSVAQKNLASGYQSSERAKLCRQRPGSMYRADQRSRVIAVSRVAPGLAQWITLIYHQKDLSRPSRRSTWCTIGLHRLLALRDFEERGPASSQPRDVKCRRHPELGPAVFTKHFQPSIQRGHLAANSAISVLRPSRFQGAKSNSVMFRCTRCRVSPGPGPTEVSGEFKAVRSQRDTWCQIKPSRHIAHRDFNQQRLALSYSRTPKA
jgi:hypothetical protein